MAEINDLLDTALERTRSLGVAAEQARANVSSLHDRARRFTDLAQSIEGETRAVCDQASDRLAALAVTLDARSASVRARLVGLIADAGALSQQAHDALAHAQSGLAQVSAAGQGALAGVQQDTQRCHQEAAGIDARADAVDGHLEQLVPEIRAGIAQLRNRLEQARQEFASGRDELSARLLEIEDTARNDLTAIVQESQTVGRAARERLERLGDDLARRAQDVAQRIAQRLTDEAVQKTREAMGALAEALDALRKSCRAHQSTSDSQADEIIERTRRIAEVLERHRPAFVCAQRVSH